LDLSGVRFPGLLSPQMRDKKTGRTAERLKVGIMNNLIVNGVKIGMVLSYTQNNQCWEFLMESGEVLRIEFSNIKMFTSCPNLDIITF
jgi:hypothetical protein